jgi:hypothetical protein
MNRKGDVFIILAAAEEQYGHIRKGYERALREESLDLRVPVKNLMENLRSALDYMAHDVYETCCHDSRLASDKPIPRNIYFPYGRTEEDYKSGVNNYLPNLASCSPAIYNLITSIQPFKCNDYWLYDLCSILNEGKHDKLTAQVRKMTEIDTVKSEFGSVSIPVNNPNIVVRSLPGAVKILGVPTDFTSEGIKIAPSNRVTLTREKWIAFTFEGSNVNVIGLFDKAVIGILDFGKKLYTLI